MTAYTKTVTASLGFIGGTNLYPDPNLYPSPDLYPYGGAIVFQENRTVTATLHPVGSLSSHAAQARIFTAVLQPIGALVHTPSRLLAGALSFAGSVAGQKSAHVFMQAVFATLSMTGALTSVHNPGFNPPGGGGFGVPMPDSHFQRYQPTLRRQKAKA